MSNPRKIAMMHKLYGYNAESCGDCGNFISVTPTSRTVFKCLRYGNTASEASDWRKSWTACGMFNIPKPENERCVIETGRGKRAAVEPPEGQMTL